MKPFFIQKVPLHMAMAYGEGYITSLDLSFSGVDYQEGEPFAIYVMQMSDFKKTLLECGRLSLEPGFGGYALHVHSFAVARWMIREPIYRATQWATEGLVVFTEAPRFTRIAQKFFLANR